MQISEARLNDLTYLALKRYFFQPMYGENACPRECDIRICMDMVCPKERIKSLSQAVLLPNEKAGASHDIMYEVDPSNVLTTVIQYMEDHWLKSSIEQAFKQDKVREEMEQDYINNIIPHVLEAAEEECGP